MPNKIIGIDLGTTNSCAAMLEGDQPQVIINSDGDRTTPSVVAWKDGERIVGKAALRQQVLNPQNTIYSVKRFIGRNFSDLTQQDLEGLHYSITEGEKGRPVVNADNRQILPEEISAAVLSKIKADCEKFIGSPVTQAVITVPAYFDDNQRQATKDAGAIAGLEVLRIINEPTAAAMAYGFAGEEGKTTKVLVFDLGGGTFDVSILDVEKDLIQVISTAGDNHLGGDIWDSTFCEYLCDRFKQETGIDLTTDPQTHSRVLEAARNAKCDLSTRSDVQVNLPFIAVGPSGPVHMDYTITRDEFERITKPLLDRCKQPIADALAGTPENPIGLTIADIDEVLLVGGSTRMPAVQQLVRDTFGKEPNATVNPDEVVAAGAAIQGGILNDECSGIVLSDVNSMPIGIKTYPNNNSIMIPANTPIPTEHTETFTNEAANQDNVYIVLVQGQNEIADGEGNKVLGTAVLPGEGRTLRDVVGGDFAAHQLQIEITVSYNVDGIIELTAREKTSGETINVKIEGTTKLDEGEVKALAAKEKIAALGSK